MKLIWCLEYRFFVPFAFFRRVGLLAYLGAHGFNFKARHGRGDRKRKRSFSRLSKHPHNTNKPKYCNSNKSIGLGYFNINQNRASSNAHGQGRSRSEAESWVDTALKNYTDSYHLAFEFSSFLTITDGPVLGFTTATWMH